MKTHQELLDQIAQLQKEADQLKHSERKGHITHINTLIAEHGIKLSELKFGVKTPSRKSVAVKYRDGDGNTWSGRGRAPLWLVAAEKSGKKRESFLV